MQIEPGRDCRTRDGRKATGLYRNPESKMFPITGEVDGHAEHWRANGRDLPPSIPSDHPLDLVAEWTEPEQHVRDDPEWPRYMAAALPLAVDMLSVSDMGEPEAGIARVAARIADAAVREGRKR